MIPKMIVVRCGGLLKMQNTPVRVAVLRGVATSPGIHEIIMDVKNSVGLVTLNRPRAMNALNQSMIRSFYPRLKEWESDPSVKCVVIKGAGDKAFCAGGDIISLTREKGGQVQKDFFREEYRLDHLVGTLGIPYIALLNGIVMGGGVGISLHGRYRVCCENTLFAMPETGIGLVPDVGGAYFLPRLQGQLGTFLGLTGHRLKGRDCLYAGLATHAVDRELLPTLHQELESLESYEPGDIEAVLSRLSDMSSFGKDKGFSLEPHMETINRIFSSDTVEEIMEKLRGEESEFARKSLAVMEKASPSSLKVALRQIREGGKLETLGDCLKMELRLVMRCCDNSDFYEGVRALLIDKDNKPGWNPATVSAVSGALVDSYFEELADELVL